MLNERFEKLIYDGVSKRGIGLQNVNERIKLHYGAESGLRIDGRLGVGTTVVIKLRGSGEWKP
ncbi:hypothetical protein D3C73_1508960 [compost metagenome]